MASDFFTKNPASDVCRPAAAKETELAKAGGEYLAYFSVSFSSRPSLCRTLPPTYRNASFLTVMKTGQ